jgi:acetyl-CoA carboxylase biotin carboxylase subunit
MIAKLVVQGRTRHEAIARLKVALSEMRIEGVSTNLALHRWIVNEPGFIEGGFDIHYLEQLLKTGVSA